MRACEGLVHMIGLYERLGWEVFMRACMRGMYERLEAHEGLYQRLLVHIFNWSMSNALWAWTWAIGHEYKRLLVHTFNWNNIRFPRINLSVGCGALWKDQQLRPGFRGCRVTPWSISAWFRIRSQLGQYQHDSEKSAFTSVGFLIYTPSYFLSLPSSQILPEKCILCIYRGHSNFACNAQFILSTYRGHSK